jgi:hypothetical protein
LSTELYFSFPVVCEVESDVEADSIDEAKEEDVKENMSLLSNIENYPVHIHEGDQPIAPPETTGEGVAKLKAEAAESARSMYAKLTLTILTMLNFKGLKVVLKRYSPNKKNSGCPEQEIETSCNSPSPKKMKIEPAAGNNF